MLTVTTPACSCSVVQQANLPISQQGGNKDKKSNKLTSTFHFSETNFKNSSNKKGTFYLKFRATGK